VPIPPRKWGRSQTPLQKLASRRNWMLAQLRGASASLRSVGAQIGETVAVDHITYLIGLLEKELDEWWESEKPVLSTKEPK